MSVNVMVVGGGAREHALCWKLAQSPRIGKLYAAPGNPGCEEVAECIDNILPNDARALADYAARARIDITVVGTEDAIVAGIADEFARRNLQIFAPRRAAALIETSKRYAKFLMLTQGIPTAPFEVVYDAAHAVSSMRRRGFPLALKADGLAQGKGVFVCRGWDDAERALLTLFADARMRDAIRGGVLVEDFLKGEEVSAHAFCSGGRTLHFPLSCDYKRLKNGNQGLNTGGMGGYAPVDWATPDQEERIRSDIDRIVAALTRANTKFIGLLYPGLMLTPYPYVLEYNVRFGDPETQSYMRLLRSDLLEPIEACIEGCLDKCVFEWHEGYAISVTLASGGYPDQKIYREVRIQGIREAERISGVKIFHAGTKMINGALVAAGGRVLSVTARAASLADAHRCAYEALRLISFEGMQYRTDIGERMRYEKGMGGG